MDNEKLNVAELSDEELEQVIGGATTTIGVRLYRYDAPNGQVMVIDQSTVPYTIYTFANTAEFYNSRFA